jgi:hypothetical protein
MSSPVAQSVFCAASGPGLSPGQLPSVWTLQVLRVSSTHGPSGFTRVAEPRFLGMVKVGVDRRLSCSVGPIDRSWAVY